MLDPTTSGVPGSASITSAQQIADWHAQRDAREVIGLLLLGQTPTSTLREISQAHRHDADSLSRTIVDILDKEIATR